MFDQVEIEATVIPFSEFAAVQVAIMADTAEEEGFQSMDEWAATRPDRFAEVSEEMRRVFRVYNLK